MSSATKVNVFLLCVLNVTQTHTTVWESVRVGRKRYSGVSQFLSFKHCDNRRLQSRLRKINSSYFSILELNRQDELT